MRRPEQRLWDRLKKANDDAGRPLLLERIENRVGAGRPDLDMLSQGTHRPIELKVADEMPARPATPLLGEDSGLNQQQKNWHKEWYRYGGKSLIIIGIPHGPLIVMTGDLGDDINKLSHQQLVAASAFVGPPKAVIEFLSRTQ